jgi:hypothetical protein
MMKVQDLNLHNRLINKILLLLLKLKRILQYKVMNKIKMSKNMSNNKRMNRNKQLKKDKRKKMKTDSLKNIIKLVL